MHTAYLLIGGNMGNRIASLREAVRLVTANVGELVQQSSLYETDAWGKEDQPSFLNQVLEIRTGLDAGALMTSLLSIENQMGRVRQEKNGSRIIDLDILLFDDERHDSEHIRIPHPGLPYRRFVLVPLVEIAAEKVDPISGKSMEQLLRECKDNLQVKKVSVS